MENTAMRIGILVGMEDSFPRALMERLRSSYGDEVSVEMLKLGGTSHEATYDYDVVLDRISHEVGYYHAHLRHMRLSGTRVINDPFVMGADDRFLDASVAARVGVRVPKVVLLPQKHYPETVTGGSLRNLEYPIPWQKHLDWVGTPAVLKPAGLKGWRQATRIHDMSELMRAFDRSGDTVMMLQEDVAWTHYVRCLVFGGEQVIIARYDPEYRQYLQSTEPLAPDLEELLVHDAARLAKALGYDLCAIEFALTEAGPVAMEFINPVPDFEVATVTPFYFEKIVEAAAALLVKRGKEGRMAPEWPPRGKSGLSAWVSEPRESKVQAPPRKTKKAEPKAAPEEPKVVRKAVTPPTPQKPSKPPSAGVRAPRKPPSTRPRNKKG